MNPVAVALLLVWLVPSFIVSLWYVNDPLGATRFFKKRPEFIGGFAGIGGAIAWGLIAWFVVGRTFNFLDEGWRDFIRFAVYIGLFSFYISYSNMKKKEQLRQEQNTRD